MQTFFPIPDISLNAMVLSRDRKRLGKQRVESLQILQTLTYGSKWNNHPAVLMWKNYEGFLIDYSIEICNQWKAFNYKDTCLEKILEFRRIYPDNVKPFWLGNWKFHLSHQSNLLRKNPGVFANIFDCHNDLAYYWPIRK